MLCVFCESLRIGRITKRNEHKIEMRQLVTYRGLIGLCWSGHHSVRPLKAPSLSLFLLKRVLINIFKEVIAGDFFCIHESVIGTHGILLEPDYKINILVQYLQHSKCKQRLRHKHLISRSLKSKSKLKHHIC